MNPPDSHPTLSAGTVIAGKFRIVRVVGTGGMGVVYEVEHELTKHRRALKVLHPRAARQPSVLDRFLREASAAARIGSAHVAETFDAGRLETGEPYLLMELVDGDTLDHRLAQEGPLSAGELSDLIHQACEGVQAAHDAGIIHRDLKPENLMITLREGAPFVKVLDFGISKFDAERTGTLGITAEGVMMGTPYYMSPEQVRGVSVVDARTDVYALGVILYECASGVRPFDALSVEGLAVAIHEGKSVPLAKRRPSLPAAFCDVVHRAMAVDREQRFESARKLGESLAPLRVRTLRAPLTGAPPPRAIVRSSSQSPPRQTDEARVSSIPPSTDAALANTLGSGSPPRLQPKSQLAVAVPALAIAIVVAVGAGAAFVALHGSPQARQPPLASADSATRPARAPAPVPLETAVPLVDAVPDSGPPRAPAATVPPPLGNREDAATFHPPPSATPKTRVDQTGLAGENPFR